MPSLTYGDGFALPNRRSEFVSFSVNSNGWCPWQSSHRRPRVSWDASTTDRPATSATSRSVGLVVGVPHDQVLRNHSVGNTCRVAGSGPRLCTTTRSSMSSGVAFACSTTTSK
jgi:hypothetical protein